MARLIDANALIARLEEHSKLFIDAWQGRVYMSPSDKARVDEIDTCIAEIINVPTVEAVEVVHGRWEQVQRWATKAKYRCSICGREVMSATKVNIEKYPYCHCGAKMDGDTD